MAQDKNNKYIKKSNENKKKEKKEKTYKNPAGTAWGRIIIFTLAILMAFGGLTALIITLILQAR